MLVDAMQALVPPKPVAAAAGVAEGDWQAALSAREARLRELEGSIAELRAESAEPLANLAALELERDGLLSALAEARGTRPGRSTSEYTRVRSGHATSQHWSWTFRHSLHTIANTNRQLPSACRRPCCAG